MKKFLAVLTIISLTALGVGCSTNKATTQKAEQKAPKVEEKITPGSVEGSTYSNPFFGLQVTIPQGWAVADNETLKALKEKGKQAIAGNDKNLNAMMDASELNTVQMFTISKYPLGTPGKANIALIAAAEKVNGIPGIKTGSDYLLASKDTLQKGQVDIVFADIKSENVGGVKFDVMDSTIKIGNATTHQKYYATIKKGYAVVITAVYSSDQDLKEINNVLSSMKMAN